MISSPLIFAFWFAHLSMLWWGAAAAAPWLIHLLSRRKHRETTWAAMEYLLAAMKRRTRRIRIEQWFLVLLRTLLILLAAVAVAEPLVDRAGLAASSGGPIHRVLVIDGSYSMDYKVSDKTRFEEAKDWASRIVDKSSPGDAFTLILMSVPPRVVIGMPAFEPRSIRDEIENLEPAHAGADLSSTIVEVRKLLEKTRRENRQLGRQEVYFLTDMQRATWALPAGETATVDFRRHSSELANLAEIMLIDLGQPAYENLAITALRASDSVVTVGRPIELAADLKDFGGSARPRQAVTLFIDRRQAAQQFVAVPARGTASVKFTYRFESAGDHSVEVRAEGDNLDVDNHRYLVVPVRQAIRALCVDGRPSGEPFQGAADYLATALASRPGPGERALIDVDLVAEGSLLERDLGPYDCVFLSNVARFTASEARVLDAYLAHGGNLIFFLGDQVVADSYDRQLGPGAGPNRILPAAIGPIVENTRKGINPLEYRHPIVQAFRGTDKAGLLTMPITKYFRLAPVAGSAAQVVLQLADGDPLMIEEPVRRGHVVLVATSADKSWTPMPIWPSFVPLMQEIVLWCASGQSHSRNVEVGEPLAASVAASAGDMSVTIERPDERRHVVPMHTEGDYSGWTYEDTYTSGIYIARLGAPVSKSQMFAVNVNTAESDLTTIGPDELQSDVWPGISFGYQTVWQAAEARAPGPIGHATPWHVALLCTLAGLLFVESLAAWRFGYHGT